MKIIMQAQPPRTVYKSNTLVTAIFKLNVNEFRLFILLLAEIDQREVISTEEFITLDISSFAERYESHHCAYAAALSVSVRSEAAYPRHGIGEIKTVGLLKYISLLLGHDRIDILLYILGRQRVQIRKGEFAVDAEYGRAVRLQVKIGGFFYYEGTQ